MVSQVSNLLRRCSKNPFLSVNAYIRIKSTIVSEVVVTLILWCSDGCFSPDPSEIAHGPSEKSYSLPELPTPNTRRRHRPIAATPSPLLDSHHHVSRRVTRRAPAIDLHRPPRRHPQCLDHLGSCCQREEHSCPGLIKSIRGLVPRHKLGELGGIECRLVSQ